MTCIARLQVSNYNSICMYLSSLYIVALAFLFTGCGSSLSKAVPGFKSVTIADEIKIGRQFRRDARKHLRFIHQPEIEVYVNQIGRRILAFMGPQPYEYRFFVVENPQLNAFAVPAGSIYIHSGLIQRVRNTDELAYVVGHEIIHVKGRHMARLSEPDPMKYIGLLGVFLTAAGPEAGAAGTLGSAIATTSRLSYTRSLEREADNLGVKYMAEAGFDPNGSLNFLKILDEERLMNPAGIPPYLLTHPLSTNRIGSVEAMIRSLRPFRKSRHSTDPIKRIQLLLRLNTAEGSGASDKNRKPGSEVPQGAENLHLRGIEHFTKGQWAEAKEIYQRVRYLEPESPGLDRDLGQVYTQLGEYPRAHEAFHRALTQDPREPLNYFYLGELFEKESQWRDAARAYSRALDLLPLWAEPARRLSGVYRKLNRLGDSYSYLARYHLSLDADREALKALDKASMQYDPSSLQRQMIQDEMQAIRERD